mmetsp:Transcript_33026/g.61912  ORF Transcript_33026/g.61912 Transcript_33026/m.61912 type:complete len:218 (-) Transcript_33026:25-678(-)
MAPPLSALPFRAPTRSPGRISDPGFVSFHLEISPPGDTRVTTIPAEETLKFSCVPNGSPVFTILALKARGRQISSLREPADVLSAEDVIASYSFAGSADSPLTAWMRSKGFRAKAGFFALKSWMRPGAMVTTRRPFGSMASSSSPSPPARAPDISSSTEKRPNGGAAAGSSSLMVSTFFSAGILTSSTTGIAATSTVVALSSISQQAQNMAQMGCEV